MKKVVFYSLLAVLLLGGVLFSARATPAAAKMPTILEFNSLVGVPRPYTGATNAIRGIPGGGLPWVVGSASGELKADGKVEVVVSGLVIDPNDPAAIAAGVAGRNPAAAFKVIVSCLSKDANGNPSTANVSTNPFPATTTGNASIEATITLPKPCIAPIVFVTSTGGSWFAATGIQ